MRFGKLCLKTDAAQYVLRFGVFFHAIVYVVRQHCRYIELFCERDETRGDALLFFDSVILHFDIVAVGAEKFGIALCDFFRMGFISVEQRLRHFALQTGRQTDKPFVIFFEQFEIDTRFIVKAFRVSDARKPRHIAVARFVFTQQNKVIVFSAVARLFLRAAVVFRDVEFFADDGIDAVRMTELFEIEYAEHIAVIGERERFHIELFGTLYERFYFCRAVEQRIIGVYVKMHELRRGSAVRRFGEFGIICHTVSIDDFPRKGKSSHQGRKHREKYNFFHPFRIPQLPITHYRLSVIFFLLYKSRHYRYNN